MLFGTVLCCTHFHVPLFKWSFFVVGATVICIMYGCWMPDENCKNWQIFVMKFSFFFSLPNPRHKFMKIHFVRVIIYGSTRMLLQQWTFSIRPMHHVSNATPNEPGICLFISPTMKNWNFEELWWFRSFLMALITCCTCERGKRRRTRRSVYIRFVFQLKFSCFELKLIHWLRRQLKRKKNHLFGTWSDQKFWF